MATKKSVPVLGATPARRVLGSQDKIGAVGVALLHTLVSSTGFVYREIGGVDLGIDMLVEVFDGEEAQGYVLVQSKCTTGKKNVTKSASIRVDNALTVFSYWRSLRAPVVVVQSILDRGALAERGQFTAKSLYAIDVSDESVSARGNTITWKRNEAKQRRTELRLTDVSLPGSIGEFRDYLVRTAARQDIGAAANALWLSDRALDAADYEAASVIVREYVRKNHGWALVQDCRIKRRRGEWDPLNTEGTLTKVAMDLSSEVGLRALQEIGYSYLIAAMNTWCTRIEGSPIKHDEAMLCDKALQCITRWVEAASAHWKRTNVSDWDGHNYVLYAALVRHVIMPDNVIAVDAAAAALSASLVAKGDVPLRANMTLWRYALVRRDCTSAVHWMDKVWPAFGVAGTLHESWRERSPQMFADAMMLRSWTLAMTSDDTAHRLFEAAQTAIQGAIKYREIEFWMHAALRACPNLA